MRKNDIFEKLNQELNGLDIPMSEKLKNTAISKKPAPEKTNERVPAPTLSWFSRNRKWTAIAASSVAFLLVGGVILSSISHNNSSTTPPTPQKDVYSSYVYLDINPSLALLLNEENKVKKVVSRNEDGDTLLKDEAFVASLVQKEVASAATLLSERAAKMGYLDLLLDGSNGIYNEIGVTMYGETAFSEETVSAIRASITDYFCESGVFVYVDIAQTVETGISETLTTLIERPQSFLDYSTLNEQIDTFSATLGFFYEFSSDILTSALEKYDLATEISAINAALESETGNSYWLTSEENENTTKMRILLDKFYHLYGEDYRKKGSLQDLANNIATSITFTQVAALYKTQAETAEEFRALLSAGLSQDNFTLAQMTKFGVFTATLGYGEELFENLSDIFDSLSSGAIDAQTAIKDFGVTYANDLYARHAAYFEALGEEKTISQTDYQNFLEKIGKNF